MEVEQGEKRVDIFRDTIVRYLGYANEVGEAFRALVHVNAVRFSYAVACTYVTADAAHKGNEARITNWPDESLRNKKILHAVLDTFLWQGLASVAIPGFTINRICAGSALILRKTTALPPGVRKWTTTFVGLAAIPFIIHPIDRTVDYGMNRTVRRWYEIGPVETKVVHHTRDCETPSEILRSTDAE
ncbi:PREDICTED: mitochondrial fission process protein 1-like [Priapulus caudatus]|uniref:Mitochondrial fission process protein 1 n=1 Tax=Priapulus caudatus TaxID=37621 RepID=A0ABM1EZM0_PRICU|nr:PREDICTED: mitochondrial fission process protein 1-like [Priapulus caudatus]